MYFLLKVETNDKTENSTKETSVIKEKTKQNGDDKEGILLIPMFCNLIKSCIISKCFYYSAQIICARYLYCTVDLFMVISLCILQEDITLSTLNLIALQNKTKFKCPHIFP